MTTAIENMLAPLIFNSPWIPIGRQYETGGTGFVLASEIIGFIERDDGCELYLRGNHYTVMTPLNGEFFKKRWGIE